MTSNIKRNRAKFFGKKFLFWGFCNKKNCTRNEIIQVL